MYVMQCELCKGMGEHEDLTEAVLKINHSDDCLGNGKMGMPFHVECVSKPNGAP